MTNKKMIPLIILNFIGILFGITANVIAALSDSADAMTTVSSVVSIVAMGFALVYLFMGYKKNAAVFYKVYTYVFAMSQIIAVIGLAKDSENFVGVSVYVILLGLILILAVVPDLGRKVTFIICGIIFALGFVLLITTLFVYSPESVSSTVDGFFRVFAGDVSVIVMSSVMWVMAGAKFNDKALRKGEDAV